MAQTLSEYLGIEPEAITQLGCFDPILNVDSLFFIDPKSVSATDVGEFENSYEKISERFAQIFKLLTASKKHGDYMWNMAYKLFPKGEVTNLCIGYGFDNTGGRGIGKVIASATLTNLKEFIDSGIDDPVLFELIGVFQEGVGSDLISDLIANIIIEDIQKYTDRIVGLLQVQTSIKIKNFGSFKSFMNPNNNKPILLIPLSFLQPLPVANDWSDIDRVCAENEEVRKKFARLIGGRNWHKATKVKKELLRNALLSEPEATADLLSQYKNKSSKSAYDFREDPNAEYSWQRYSNQFAKSNPLVLSDTKGDPEKVKNVVIKIIEQFQHLIENGGLNKALYNEKTKKVMNERQAQRVFYGIADTYCLTNNLDISPETNSGKGPIDFKFSEGKASKILVEIKLTSNSKIDHGLKIQLREYKKAEKPYASFLLVISVDSQYNYQKKLNKEIAEMIARKEEMPEIRYVNGSIKPSASKMKS